MYIFLLHTMESLLLVITFETSPIEKIVGTYKKEQLGGRTHKEGNNE